MALGEVKTLLFADGVNVQAGAPASSGYVFDDAVNWNGSQVQVTYDVTGKVPDARTTAWTLKDVASAYKQIAAEIDSPSATQVRVTVGIPLAAGTYRLIGVY